MNFFNEWHLGDCLYTIHYFNKLIRKYSYLEIHFYCNSDYHKELQLWNRYRAQLFLHDISLKPENSINTWIGENDFYWKNLEPAFNGMFDVFYIEYFKNLSSHIGLESPIVTPEDFLFDNEEILTQNVINEEFDVLIINSKPFSNQIDSDSIRNLNKFSLNLIDSNYKAISTEKINDAIPSTIELEYSLLQLAKMSTQVDIIIGIHTAPMLVCFNKYNIDKVQQWILLQKQGLTYSFNSRIYNFRNSNQLSNLKTG